MLKPLLKLLTSMKLTVVCLGLAVVLVFVGTLAQVHDGLYVAQTKYFKSFFVTWSPADSSLRIPIFPGGYLIGAVLVLNLVAGHVKRLKFTRKSLGLWTIHLGLILLLLGQLMTDLLSTESALRLQVGETKHYSEDFFATELALVDKTDAEVDTVTSVPWSLIHRKDVIPLDKTGLVLRVRNRWDNAEILRNQASGDVPAAVTRGIGQGLFVRPLPLAKKMDERNTPAAIVELMSESDSLGVWLVSTRLAVAQELSHQQRDYELALRPKRHYTPFSITLIDCQHDLYPGTDLPKNFSSRVRVKHPKTKEDRETLIYMNNPLRYGGLTYYQFQMDALSAERAKSSTLQVVRNPGWLTPYLACILVGLGLLLQFIAHLWSFLRQRAS